jgi:hypothetical protein
MSSNRTNGELSLPRLQIQLAKLAPSTRMDLLRGPMPLRGGPVRLRDYAASRSGSLSRSGDEPQLAARRELGGAMKMLHQCVRIAFAGAQKEIASR